MEISRTMLSVTLLFVIAGFVTAHIFQKPSHKRTKVKAEIAWLDHYLLGKPFPEIK